MATPISATVLGASDRFRLLIESLPDEERQLFASCNNADNLLDNVKAFEFGGERRDDQGKKMSRRYIELIKTFIEAVQPMFGIMDLLSSVNPLHVATVWGGIRVVLQLTLNFVSFYEKIAKSLREMSHMISFFRKVKADNLVLRSDNLKSLLENIFAEILDYLAGIIGLFHTSHGKAKSRVRVYAGAAFKPFRYDQVLSQMKEYRSTVTSELVRIQALQMHDISQALPDEEMNSRPQKESNEAVLQRFKQWLAPTTYTSRYEDARSLRTSNTSQWIFDDTAYQKWSSVKNSSALLWIHGKPGSGKTILAATLVEYLKDTGITPFYFFFDSLQPSSKMSLDAYTAILSQILHKHPSNPQLIDLFHFSICFATDGQPTATTREAAELLELCLQLADLEGMTLVLDGLDECQDALQELMPLIKRVNSQASIRLILLGRSSIRSYLKGLPSFEDLPVAGSNLHDIRVYFQDELETCVNDELLPKGLDIEATAENLSRRADGMFLWARLMMTYLASPGLLVSERQEAIRDIDMPEGLEIMYERILVQMYKTGRASVRLASHIFTCLLYGQRPLTERELEDSVISRKRGGIDEQSRTFPNFVDTILLVCGGFVERSLYDGFRFIHASVHDYFMDEPRRRSIGNTRFQDPILVSAPVAANLRLATHCLQYINYALPEERLVPPEPARLQLERQFPLSKYATTYWHAHMLATNGTLVEVQAAHKEEPDAYGEFISALCQLLSRPPAISAWIQSCFAFLWEPPHLLMLNWTEQCSSSSFPWRHYSPQIDDIIPDVQELVQYLKRIIMDWGAHLHEDPSCIFDEAAAFTKSEFVTQPPDITVRSLVSIAPASHLSSEPLHKVSKLISDGKRDHLLSIFPTMQVFSVFRDMIQINDSFCSAYLEWSRHLNWDSDFSEIEQHSQGWVARLEIFDIEQSNDNVIGSLEMAIDSHEVLLQLSQTMMCSSSGAVVQFPISLSPDGRAFTILRTVYRLGGSLDGLCVTSHKLPIQPSHQFWQPSISCWKPDARSLYLYWVYFDDAGQYLCFVEQFINHDLAISAIRYNRAQNIDTDPQFIAKRSIPLPSGYVDYYPGRNRREFEVAYHPFVAAAVVAGYEEKAFLWTFGSPQSLQPLCDVTSGRLEMLSFTSDGKSVVLKRRGDLPSAISVESDLLSQSKSSSLLDPLRALSASSILTSPGTIMAATDLVSNTEIDDDNESDSIDFNMPSSRAVASKAGGGVIRAGSNAVAHVSGKDVKEVFLTVSDRQVVVSRVPSLDKEYNNGTSNENDQQKQLTLPTSQNLMLTRIPNWGFKAASPSVVLPREGGDPVRIVLDKESTTANRVSPSSSVVTDSRLSQQHSPVVVERHIRSIQRQNQYYGQEPLLLSAPRQPEYNYNEKGDEDSEANPLETVDSDTGSSTAGSTVLDRPLPTIVIDGFA
ncbi:hypothetical protein ACHAQJ_000447 [Trichoderma viride]